MKLTTHFQTLCSYNNATEQPSKFLLKKMNAANHPKKPNQGTPALLVPLIKAKTKGLPSS